MAKKKAKKEPKIKLMPSQCLGYGKYKYICTNDAGGEMRPRSTVWCDRCEKLRRATVTKRMKSLVNKFGWK